jgi:hypothetical protein
MRYKSFQLINFKGVVKATVSLSKTKGADVVTLIGLNESGKTTILEGIYSFSPDPESGPLFDEKLLSPDPVARIPKSRLFNFSDNITIAAQVELDEGERDQIVSEIQSRIGVAFDGSGIPDEFRITDASTYNNSKRVSGSPSWSVAFRVKGKQAKNWRPPKSDERKEIFAVIQSRIPSIAYFPTFLSDVPAKLYLRGK